MASTLTQNLRIELRFEQRNSDWKRPPAAEVSFHWATTDSRSSTATTSYQASTRLWSHMWPTMCCQRSLANTMRPNRSVSKMPTGACRASSRKRSSLRRNCSCAWVRVFSFSLSWRVWLRSNCSRLTSAVTSLIWIRHQRPPSCPAIGEIVTDCLSRSPALR